MTIKEFLEALSKWSPIKIENNFYLGKNVMPIKDSKVLIDNKEIAVSEDKQGKLKVDIKGTELERFIVYLQTFLDISALFKFAL